MMKYAHTALAAVLIAGLSAPAFAQGTPSGSTPATPAAPSTTTTKPAAPSSDTTATTETAKPEKPKDGQAAGQ